MDDNDPKAENLMLSIWRGKESNRCDGGIVSFSQLSHIVLSGSKKMAGGRSNYFSMVGGFFNPNFKVDYWF